MKPKTTARTVAMSLAVAGILLGTAAQGAITFLKNWGSAGSGDGQFYVPAGVAVNSAGEVYVSDHNNCRIQKFTSNGVYQSQFGTWGSGDGQFSYPEGVAVNSLGEVYVVDGGNNRIQKFTGSGVYQFQFGGSGSGNGQFNLPKGLAVNSAGEVYVVDQSNNRIQKFNGYGTYLSQFGTYGTGNGQFFFPAGVAVNSADEVYVADTSNDRIQKFTAAGAYQSQFGSFGSGNGQLYSPAGVAVNSLGEVYVADTSNSRIQKFTASGAYLSQFGGLGSGDGQFIYPQAVAVNSTGEVYVADFSNRISKWFDLDAWTSGAPHLDAAAVGPAALLGAALYLDATRGLQVDGLLTVQPGGYLTQQGGNITAGQLQNNGALTLGLGTLTVGGGLTNNTSMTMSGGGVAGNVSNAYGALCTAQGLVTGSMTNNGTLALTGLLSVGPMTNAGTMNIGSGQQLTPANLTNSGMLNLSGGAVSSAGGIQNAAAGTIRGEGALAAPLTNEGLVDASGANALVLAQFSGANQPSGELRVENGSTLQVLGGASTYFANLGLIALKGPNAAFGGDMIINQGTIQGQGRVSNSVYNQATIRAEGGQLNFFGSDNNNSGTIECPAGGTVAFSQGLAANMGLIALDGGAFNTGTPLTNYGSIRGHGTLRTAALDNFASITFSEGSNSIFGNVTNEAGGNIYNYGNTSSLTTFFNAVTNLEGAHFGVKGGTVRFLGPFVNSGTYDTDPADNYFSNLTLTASGVLRGGTGDRFLLSGALTSAGTIDLGGSTTIIQNGNGDLVQTAGSLTLGDGGSIAARTLHIQGGTISADGPTALVTASLDYTSPESSTFQGAIAGSGKTIVLNNPAAVLTLSGHNTFSGGASVNAGTLVIANLEALPNGSAVGVAAGAMLVLGDPSLPDPYALAVSRPIGAPLGTGGMSGGAAIAAHAVPEPGTLVLLAAGLAFAAALALRRRIKK